MPINDGRGAHQHGEPLSFEEAREKSVRERKEWAERDRANGTVYVHPKDMPKQVKHRKPKPEELFIGPPDPRAGRKR